METLAKRNLRMKPEKKKIWRKKRSVLPVGMLISWYSEVLCMTSRELFHQVT